MLSAVGQASGLPSCLAGGTPAPPSDSSSWIMNKAKCARLEHTFRLWARLHSPVPHLPQGFIKDDAHRRRQVQASHLGLQNGDAQGPVCKTLENGSRQAVRLAA